ncbi:MAG TPA: YggS family pyridoxal phosphate-dependent enzyme, partial [Chitinophagaceae bacterium]|nr:YggS family pyridoxal phosphate-dependent enzyme [Chitinophagaceae bacterium]
VRWHFIGHLQSNKVKYIAAFVHLIHGVDSLKLLQEINKQAGRHNRIISVLLQLHIAKEETKFGLDEEELKQQLQHPLLDQLENIQIAGLMGMASFSNDESMVRAEFRSLREIFDRYKTMKRKNVQLEILSMGMSGDYALALQEGSTMLRIGSLLFGARN